jgi:enoyl-CoA hydratase/carnithine racemase
VPKHELRARAQAHLEKMTALPATAYALAKEALHRGLESSMESEWQATVLAQGILLSSNDFKNRVAARRPGKR